MSSVLPADSTDDEPRCFPVKWKQSCVTPGSTVKITSVDHFNGDGEGRRDASSTKKITFKDSNLDQMFTSPCIND